MASHVASAVRKQERGETCTQLASALSCLSPPSFNQMGGMVPPTFRVGLLSSVKPPANTLIAIARVVSRVVLYPVQLMVHLDGYHPWP